MIYSDIVHEENDVIQALEQYRLENRITQKQLAEVLGVAFVTVSRWLNGHTKPNKIQAFHIRKLVGPRSSRKINYINGFEHVVRT